MLSFFRNHSHEEDGTIVFEVLKDVTTDDLKKLVPTIEVSAKCNCNTCKWCNCGFFFKIKAILSVVAEDGSSKIYTASISGRAFVVSYDFEEWDPVTHKPMFGDEETFTTPTGWCTSNYGIVEMGIFKPMLGVSGWLVTEEK